MRCRRALWIAVLGLAFAPAARADSTGSWSALPAMGTARYGAVAAELSDGRVLVAGGLDGSGNPTTAAEVYDPTANAWSATAAMGSARTFAAAAALANDRVLVVGGDVGGSPSASAEIYNGATGTWSAAAPMAVARERGVAAALPDGTAWVAGGESSGSGEIYDPVAGAWSGTVGGSAVGAVAAPLGDGRVLFTGGFDITSSAPNLIVSLENPAGHSGSQSPTLPAPLYQAAAAALPAARVLVVGGSASQSSPSGSASAEIYDALSSQWSPAAAMGTARYGAVAAPLPDGRVLVAGGEGASGALASAEVFSPPAIVPVNTSAPQIVDTGSSAPAIRVGDVVSPSVGTWYDAHTHYLTYSYHWQRCRPSCVDAGSASLGDSYTVSAADVGATLRLVVTAFGSYGSASAVSNEIGPVAEPGFRLANPGSLLPVFPLLAGGIAGAVSVPVIRDVATGAGSVGYRVWDPSGRAYPPFTAMSGVLHFADGQSLAEITISTMDHGVSILPDSLDVALDNGSPLSVVPPSQATFLVSTADPSLYFRDPLNPLGLPHTPRAGDPLSAARFFADYSQSPAGHQALAWAASNPPAASKVALIAAVPNTERLSGWNGPFPGANVSAYLTRAAAQEPGTVPMISTYRIVHGRCGQWSDPAYEQTAYHDWIINLAEGIGTHPAVLFLEVDSLATVGCLSHDGVSVRMQELRDAVNLLSAVPHLVTYLDAGAADALPAREAASLLRRAGVAQVQGFFLNSTHFDWTSKEIAYGERISRLTGGKHFVINTAENGQGPLRPRDRGKQGNEVLCNPAGRGLGPLPTATTGYPNVDAFAWIANPGVSAGRCRPGAPAAGVFWPQLALDLLSHANFRVR